MLRLSVTCNIHKVEIGCQNNIQEVLVLPGFALSDCRHEPLPWKGRRQVSITLIKVGTCTCTM